MKSDQEKKRGVVYARVNENARSSLIRQIAICQEKMKAEMVEEVHTPIIDVGSGMSSKRPGLEELQKLAKSRSIDILYVYDLARLSRNMFIILQLVQNIERSDILVNTIDGEIKFPHFA